MRLLLLFYEVVLLVRSAVVVFLIDVLIALYWRVPQLFADPYKATITKDDGSEVEEDIYESYNLTLVMLSVCCWCDGSCLIDVVIDR